METENKIFKIQTAFYRLLSEILKDKNIEIFKILKGNMPNQFIFIESVKEEFLQGKYSQFTVVLKFISEASKILEISGFMEKVKFELTKNNFENEIMEEIVNLKLLQNVVQNFQNSGKVEGRMDYICFC
jgi:hypothetical protein